MDASVVICTHNRAASLRQTLGSLRQMSVRPELMWEVIVVDNNSPDATRAVVEEFARTSGLEVRYVFEPNLGLCHARNAAVANAAGEVIVFTDDDVVVAPEWLAEVMRAFREFDCAGVGGRCIPWWGALARPGWLAAPGPFYLGKGPLLDFDLGDEAKLTDVPLFGLNMAFRKSVFEKHGLFRTDLDVVGSGGLLGGDTEFGKRLLSGGEKIAYSPKAVVFHPVPKERLTKSYFLSYYIRQGRTAARLRPPSADAVLWFGVPRTFFRSLFESCWGWLTTFVTAVRFYHRAHAHFHLGRILETRRLRSGQAPRESTERNPIGKASLNLSD